MRHFHKRLTVGALAVAIGSLALGACGGASRASLLRDRLQAGCLTHGECSMLWAEARAREQECRHERHEDCSDEGENLRLAERLLRPHEAQAKANITSEREARAGRERQARERQARERETRDRQAREREAAREEERRRAAEEAITQETLRRHQRASVYEAMSPEERSRYLRACFTAGSEVLHPDLARIETEGASRLPCDVLLTRLVAATPSPVERDALLRQLEERVSARKEPAAPEAVSPAPASSGHSSPSRASGSSGSGSARCCDGTRSKTCGCGGGRGCCSRHGGVCGCVD